MFSPGMRVRLVSFRDSEDCPLGDELIIHCAYDAESWWCDLDINSDLGRCMGYFGDIPSDGLEGRFGCFFYSEELQAVGPPNTVREMSYKVYRETYGV